MKRYSMAAVLPGDMMIESPEGAYVRHADVVEMAQDEARYQYYRSHRLESLFRYGVDEDDSPEKLDAAIDAAMEGK